MDISGTVAAIVIVVALLAIVVAVFWNDVWRPRLRQDALNPRDRREIAQVQENVETLRSDFGSQG